MMRAFLAVALLSGSASALDWSGDPLTGVSRPRFETVLQAQPLGSAEVAKIYTEEDAPSLSLSVEADGRVLIEFSGCDTTRKPEVCETRTFIFPQLRYDPAAKTISRDGQVIGRLGSWLWKFEPGWTFDYTYTPEFAGKFVLSVFLRKA